MFKSPFTPIVVVAALAASLTLSACTDSEDESSPAAETNEAAEETAAETAEETSAEEGESSGGLELPAQTIGEIADCPLWTFESLGEIWGVTFTDTDENQVIEVNGPGTFLYSCDYNETDSGLGLTVVIEFKEYLTEDEAIVSMNNTRDGASFGDTVYFINEEVSGVGDEAFFSYDVDDEGNPTPIQIQIYARYGNVVILGSAVDLDGLASADGAKDGLVTTLTSALG